MTEWPTSDCDQIVLLVYEEDGSREYRVVPNRLRTVVQGSAGPDHLDVLGRQFDAYRSCEVVAAMRAPRRIAEELGQLTFAQIAQWLTPGGASLPEHWRDDVKVVSTLVRDCRGKYWWGTPESEENPWKKHDDLPL